MKITVNIDCTPEEARIFLGLPDVSDLQKALVAQIQERMLENLSAMEPDKMMKLWMPSGIQGFEQMQKIFMNQMGMNRPDKSKDKDRA